MSEWAEKGHSKQTTDIERKKQAKQKKRRSKKKTHSLLMTKKR